MPATSILKVEVRREDLDVAGPSEAFVALRAVGRDIEEVAARLHGVVLELGRQLVGAGETRR